MSLSRPFIIIAVLCPDPIASAYAQEAGLDEIVVTASGFPQPRSESGQAITVVDRERLEQLQTSFLGDVIQTFPSVAVRQSGGPGSQTSVFIRGGNSAQTLVLVDGVRINDPSSPNGAFDFGALTLGEIEQVEVLRGPNSVIWGSQAMGGVVSVRTRTPVESLTFRAGAEAGALDTQQTYANLAGASGPLESSIGASWYHSDGISSLSGGQEHDGYRNLSAHGRLKLRLSQSIHLDLRGYYNRGRIAYDDPWSLAGAESAPISRNRQFLSYAGLHADLLDGRWRNRLSYSRTDIRRRGTDPVPFSFNTFRVEGTVDRFEYHGAVDATTAISVIYGVEHERTGTSTSYEGAAPDITHSHLTGMFAQAIVRPAVGLTVTGGIRHDDYSVYGGHTTLGGNIAWTPDRGRTVLRATYAEGFRAPTVTEGLPPFGNPHLDPETARSFDVGIEHRTMDGKAQIFATWFHRVNRDLIAGFPPDNIDRALAQGLELGARLSPVDTLDVQIGYGLVDARNRSSGSNFNHRLQRRARHQASLTADWRSGWGLAVGGTILLIGDSFDDAANTVRLDGYALANVRASYSMAEGVELYGRIENLFDSDYEAVAGYGTTGRAAYAGVRLTL